MERLIFEDEHIEVYYWPRDDTCETIIITFCELGTRSGEGAWGRTPLSNIGLPYIGFVSKYPNWFPSQSVAVVGPIINELTNRYKNIVTYGHSQGGYAAIKHCKTLNATSAISFCPQYSIDPLQMGGQDLRYKNFFSEQLMHKEITADDVGPSTAAFIFYDPLDKLDKLNTEHIVRVIPWTRMIKILGTGHQTIRAVASSRGLRGIIAGVITNDEFRIRDTILHCKREWVSRGVYLARALSARRPKLAVKLINLCTIEIAPEILVETITNLFRAGEHNCLVNNIEQLSKYADNNTRVQLLDVLIIMDRLDMVVNYGGMWLRRHGQLDQDIAVRLGKAVTPTFQLLSLKPPTSTTITYCEGWHSTEDWGRWGGSVRSRIVINFPPYIKRPTQMLIPAATFSSEQMLRICYYANGSWQDAIKHDHRWSIPTDDEDITVDFMVDHLQSPDQAHKDGDLRFLGVKLVNATDWTFI